MKKQKLKQKCGYCKLLIPKDSQYYFEGKRFCSPYCFQKHKELEKIKKSPDTSIRKESWLNQLHKEQQLKNNLK
jgi:hypothetical protein